MSQNYTIGLDIGTNSVGWAVLTENYQLLSKRMKVKGNVEKNFKKKNLWGVRLFDEGQVAMHRRLNRTNRRRIARRRNRIQYVQDIFAPEMIKTDRNFFVRLNESFLVTEDKIKEKHPIFGTLEEEVAYHQQFPTIYHLRKYLADTKERVDIRLVYLAVAHIVKFRGHFLIEGELNTENSSIKVNFNGFLQEYNQLFPEKSVGQMPEALAIETVFVEKISRSKKAESVLALCQQKKNTLFHKMLKLIVGLKADFKKDFQLEEKAELQFSSEEYENDLESLLGKIGDEYSDLFSFAKKSYDAVELSSILTVKDDATKAKLSASMIQRFNEHKEDIKRLKVLIREKLPESYKVFFTDITVNGYAGYIDGKTNQSDFYVYTKKLLEKVEGAKYFLEKIEQENFLRKQRTFDNGVIPHQIHQEELGVILRNQSQYYPFLQESFKKINQIFEFRIPYYIGPLANGHSDFAWLTRHSKEKITPWNLEQVVDINQSAIQFIENMTNNDLYLPEKKVLPKHSMLYEKFVIFNELTKVRYIDERGHEQNFSSTEKMTIFELFKKQRKVKKQDLEQLLEQMYAIEKPKILGIENEFNGSYSTYHDFKKVGIEEAQLEDPENEDLFEAISKILTIFEDRKMIREQLKKYSKYFSQDVLKKLERRHFTGWGRLSKELIHGIREKETNKTILDYLINDDGPSRNINRNFMQLITDDAISFQSKIADAQRTGTEESFPEIVAALPGSPAIKKGILQSLTIVQELVRVMGYPPTTIVVEMARENQTTQQGKRNSIPRRNALEESLRALGSDLVKDLPDNQKLQKNKLYLYYLQNGKDMYDKNIELDINNLSQYEIDHIIPQSFIKDDSIDNLVLTSSSLNSEKGDHLPLEKWVRKQLPFWEKLRSSNLISQRKFDRLKKIEVTEDDKANFIKRQLVETRQMTKHVAGILDSYFNAQENDEQKNNKKVRIITLKSALTSKFREMFDLYKVREINDYHHAHDAYLNGVVANTLLKVYPKLEPEFVYGKYPKYNSRQASRATAKKMLSVNVMKFFTEDHSVVSEEGEILWNKNTDIKTIKKVLGFHQMNVTKKLENRASNETGKQLYKQTIAKRGQNGKNKIKTKYKRSDGSVISLEIDKYGGYIEEKEAFITIENGKLKSVKRTEESLYQEYPKILRNQVYLQPEGFYRTVSSFSEAGKWNQMYLENQLVKYIFYLKQYHHFDQKVEVKDFVDNNRHLFDEIKDQAFHFIEKNKLAKVGNIRIPEERTVTQDLEIILGLLNITSSGTTSENTYTVSIDEQGKERKEKINPRIRYQEKLRIGKTILVSQSVTGLYETRTTLGED